MMQRIGDSQYEKQAMAVARLLVIALTVVSAQLMFALPAFAAGLHAQTQSQSIATNKNAVAKFVMITVPVHLSNLDSRVHYGMISCGITVYGKGLFGGDGDKVFSINSSDGSFNGNVKVSVSQGNFPDSVFAQELDYHCGLFMSEDNHFYYSTYTDTKNMLQPKPGSPFVLGVNGKVPALK